MAMTANALDDNTTQSMAEFADDSMKKQPPQHTIHLLLHCQDGCVPYLNPTQLEQYFPPTSGLWLGLAVQDTCVMPLTDKFKKKKARDDVIFNKDAAAAAPKKIRGYTFSALASPDPWLLPYTRVTVPSFPDDKKEQVADNKSISVWTPHGRQKLTCETYTKVAVEGLQSTYTVSMCDDNPGQQQSDDAAAAGRWQKVQTRNNQWSQQLVEAVEQHGSGEAPSTIVWKSVIIPPWSNDSQYNGQEENVAVNIPQADGGSKAKGIAFLGQWRPDLLNSKNAQHQVPSRDSFEWRCLLSTKSLHDIVEAVAGGYMNVIGTDLPTKWAKGKLALAVEFSQGLLTAEPASKRPKLESTGDEAISDSSCRPVLNSDGCMNMADPVFARDPKPLVGGCRCMACQDGGRFSRAYIHHLVCAKELLAEILLFAHNLHHLMQLIETFNDTNNDCAQIANAIKSQLPQIQTQRN